MKIKLAHLKQEKDYTCLPATIRIVLKHFKVNIAEGLIAKVSNTSKRGTNLEEAAESVEAFGFKAIELEEASLAELVEFLDKNLPVIAVVDAEYLPYGKIGLHAIVVNGIEGNRISFIDPALGKEFSLPLLAFFKAWDARGRCGLVIYRKLTPKTKTRKKKK